MIRHPRLPALLILACLPVVWLVGHLIVAQPLLWAQVDAPPAAAGTKPADSAAATPSDVVKESPEAAEIMKQVRQRLFERPSVQARLNQTVYIGDQTMHNKGTYIAGAYPKMKIEYEIRIGEMRGRLLEMCDGQVMHTRRQISRANDSTEEAVETPADEPLGESPTASDADSGQKSGAKKPTARVSTKDVQLTRCDVQQVLVASTGVIVTSTDGTKTVNLLLEDNSGNQNTEKPYAMPMHRWMASAAGGTSQRLNPGPAMMRSLSRIPDMPDLRYVF